MSVSPTVSVPVFTPVSAASKRKLPVPLLPTGYLDVSMARMLDFRARWSGSQGGKMRRAGGKCIKSDSLEGLLPVLGKYLVCLLLSDFESTEFGQWLR